MNKFNNHDRELDYKYYEQTIPGFFNYCDIIRIIFMSQQQGAFVKAV